jgi:predicted ATPase
VNQLETSALPVYRMYLAAVAQGQGLAAEVARSLGLLEQAMSPLEMLKLHFEGQRAVLLLDNLEQMHGADEAVCSFLEACPSVQVLITSRRALGTKMERVWSVQPFEVPEPQMTLEALVAMPAVALCAVCSGPCCWVSGTWAGH